MSRKALLVLLSAASVSLASPLDGSSTSQAEKRAAYYGGLAMNQSVCPSGSYSRGEWCCPDGDYFAETVAFQICCPTGKSAFRSRAIALTCIRGRL
jgi:hypothetical protein